MQKTRDIIRSLWTNAGLPADLLDKHNLHLELENEHVLPSSFRIGAIAQALITAVAVAASLYRHLRTRSPLDDIKVNARHAALEFASERCIRLSVSGDNIRKSVPATSDQFKSMLGLPTDMPTDWDVLSGFYSCKDGKFVRLHTNWPHHKLGLLKILGLNNDATRTEVEASLKTWEAESFESAAREAGMCATMCRTKEGWYSTDMGQSILVWLQENNGSPVKITKTETSSREDDPWTRKVDTRPLHVIDMSRVIAAPVATRALANHGADVIAISNVRLANLPILELDTARGKRACNIDLEEEGSRDELKRLIRESDVLLQAYRPGSLAEKGFSREEVQSIRPGLIYAELDAYGFTGPWKDVRGFDSLVQCASGINLSEAQSHEQYASARESSVNQNSTGLQPLPLPCQALDHASGYLLAFGILAAKCRLLLDEKSKDGHSWHIQVSLAATAAWMQSLGTLHGREAWEIPRNIKSEDQEVQDLLEPYQLRSKEPYMDVYALKHSASNATGQRRSIPSRRDLDEARWSE